MKRYLIFILSFAIIFNLVGISPTEAVTTPVCKILNATIDPSTAKGSSNDGFFSTSNGKNTFVTITVKTENCIESKKVIYVSLVNYNDGVPALNNKPFTTTRNDFKITLIAGEDLCGDPLGLGLIGEADCKYAVRVGFQPNQLDFYSRDKPSGNLDYECEGICDAKWSYVKVEGIGNTPPPTNPPLATKVDGADGACDQAFANQPRQSTPVSTDSLCTKGTPIDIKAYSAGGYSGWSWTCLGELGKNGGTSGKNSNLCMVRSVASLSGARCGTAFDDDLTVAPSTPEALCAGGTSSTVQSTTSGWSWTCTLDTTTVSCTANRVAGTPPGPGDSGGDESNFLPSNFLQNPFKTLDTFPKILKAVVDNIVLPIAVPFIGLMIIYSGMLFVIAKRGGKVYTLEKAKQQLLYTLIGAVLVLGVWVIVNALEGTLSTLTSYNYHHDYQSLVINKRV